MIEEKQKFTESQGVMLAELDNKVQFIYEIAFAKRELNGLGAKSETRLGDTIRFELIPPFDEGLLTRRLAHFRKVGQRETEYSWIVSKNIKRSENQYLTHWYYPYKGKYHPRLVRATFNIIGLRFGQTVLDPFVGSGTTTLEAHIFGLNSVGFDISPVCVIMSKVKISAGEVAEIISQYRDLAITAMKKEIDKIPKSSKQLQLQKLTLNSDTNFYKQFLDTIEDKRVRDFYLLAQLIFASDRGRRSRDFGSFAKNLDNMILSAHDLTETENRIKQDRSLGKSDIQIANATSLPLKDESIDAIVTSPPYSIALNYMENDKYALKELDINIDKLSNLCIGVRGQKERRLEFYEADMEKCYAEMYRVLKYDSKCVLVIGEAKYKTIEHALDYCKNSLGFTVLENLPKKIFGLYNTISDEKVIFLQK